MREFHRIRETPVRHHPPQGGGPRLREEEPRNVGRPINWNPSATEGNVLKNWSSSRRMYSRSAGVKSAPEGLSEVVMGAFIARPAPPTDARI
jgi:hypothetical protein